tara:strand:- start:158 stop:646 length:489 start_codon:yes stop_codon:yes gene_type:complete
LNKKYNFYKSDDQRIKELNIPNGYDFLWFKPKLLKLQLHGGSVVKYLLWYFFTLGRYKILYIKNKKANKYAHWSNIMPKTWQYPFMSKQDKHIISCYTEPSDRGKGLYPFAIELARKKYSDIWIISEVNNIASNNGIIKTGFTFAGSGFKNSFKRYILNARS